MTDIYDTMIGQGTKMWRAESPGGWAGKKRMVACIALLMVVTLATTDPAPATSDGSGLRVVKIKVVAEQSFARLDAWQRIAAEYIAEASQLTGKFLQVQFEVVGYEKWNGGDGRDLFEVTSRMMAAVKPGEADAVVGFRLAPRPSERVRLRIDGVTLPFRGMLITVYQGSDDDNRLCPFVLLHETVHLFGGIHIDENSLMSPELADTIVTIIDPVNLAIVDASRTIDFKAGYNSLDSLRRARLTAAYETGYEDRRYGRTEEVLTRLWMLYAACQECERGRRFFDRVGCEGEADLRQVGLRTADCYLMTNRPAKAIAELERLVTADSTDGVAHSRLAVIYYNQRNASRAAEHAVAARRHGATVDPKLWQALKKGRLVDGE